METHCAIWPCNNNYLRIGLDNLLKSEFCRHHFDEFIFVDFSLYNIKLFTNDNWLDFIEKTHMYIILIHDKHMEALANYWSHASLKITKTLSKKESFKFITLSSGRERRLYTHNSITDAELTVLNLALAGRSVRDIAYILGCHQKRIYSLQYSIERKMGIRLKSIFIGTQS